MSKKVATQPLSDNTRKLIIIIAIVLVAIIVLSIALALILKTDAKTPGDENSGSNGSSSLPIRNGDFAYITSDDTGYPKTAQNWTKYGYKAPSGTSHDFQSISDTNKSVMGIVNVKEDNWADVVADLSDYGIPSTLANPSIREGLEDEDDNVYMIYNKEKTAASILSDSASVASGASIKITIWLNTAYVEEGDAVIMIQKSSVSALEENWYAYNFNIKKDDSGWKAYEFYVFNRESSTKYIRVSVGLGNAYKADSTAQGVLFVDDITYETKTANEYRDQVDNHTSEIIEKSYKPYKIIENEDITDKSTYNELVAANSDITLNAPYKSYDEFAADEEILDEDGKAYLPFTTRDDFGTDKDPTGFKIYRIAQKGEHVTELRMQESINLIASPIEKDHYHISFWLRVEQKDGHQATQANVYVQKKVDGKWEDINGGSFTSITTSQDIDTDANCGWVKYDVYLKPTTAQNEEINILFVLGNKDGYEDDDVRDGIVPRGSLYVTTPASEKISYKDYNSASSGTYVKKLNLLGTSASTSVTNGSFSDENNIGNQPTGWTPVFAGDNAIYKDGKDDQMDKARKEASRVAGSGLVKNESAVDDSQGNVLKITTNGTNFGYISNDIALAARTVYVFSVLVKGDGPFFYLVDNSKETREAAIVATASYQIDDEKQKILDEYFDYSLSDVTETPNDWKRAYIVYVTGNETATVRIALFHGQIYKHTSEDESSFKTGTVYYDNVKMKSIGTYSLNVPDDYDEDSKEQQYYNVKFSAGNGYAKAIEDLTGKDMDGIKLEDSKIIAALGEGDANGFAQPSNDDWNEMRKIPEKEDDNDGDGDENDTKTPSDVDVGLLMSAISSIVLVAALLIVFVIKIFQRKRPRAA